MINDTKTTIIIKTLSEMKIEIEVHFEDTVFDLKNRLFEKKHIEDKEVFLLHQGERLDNNKRIYNLIENGKKNVFFLFNIEPVYNKTGIEKMIKNAKNWEIRNKIQTYLGVYLVYTNMFQEANSLLTETLSVFSSPEFFSYSKVVCYTLLTGCVVLNRTETKKLIEMPEVLEALNENKTIFSIISSLYNCDYKTFFSSLLLFYDNVLTKDWILKDQADYIVRKLRIRVYQQIFESYNNVSLQTLSSNLGLSIELIEEEIADFVVSGRLFCAINKQTGFVEKVKDNKTVKKHKKLLEEGEILTTRIGRLVQHLNP